MARARPMRGRMPCEQMLGGPAEPVTVKRQFALLSQMMTSQGLTRTSPADASTYAALSVWGNPT